MIKNLNMKNKGKSIIINKEEKSNLKLLDKNIKRVINVKNKKIFGKSNYSLANPIKQQKRSLKGFNNIVKFNNIVSSKKVIYNINNISSKEKINIDKTNKTPYNMNEKKIYEMFLKINKNSDSELNELSYRYAIKIDKRTYFQYYLSLLRTKHLLFFSFCPTFDYNSQILKIFLFFFEFALSFLVNALFFNDETMSKIYEEKGTFNFINNIPQILYSSFISGFIDGLIQSLALTDSKFITLKHNIDRKKVIIKKAKNT